MDACSGLQFLLPRLELLDRFVQYPFGQ